MSRSFRFAFAAVCLLLIGLAGGQVARGAVSLVTPGNVLAGQTTVGSSSILTYVSSKTVDQLLRGPDPDGDNGEIFSDADTDQRLSITGFNSGLGEIRLYTNTADPDRIPHIVTIRSSTASTNSLSTGAYGTVLYNSSLTGSFINPSVDSQIFYVAIPVSAPVGTQSLLFDFGPATPGVAGARISEVQAFAPEPTTSMTAIAGLVVLATTTNVRRRARARACAN